MSTAFWIHPAHTVLQHCAGFLQALFLEVLPGVRLGELAASSFVVYMLWTNDRRCRASSAANNGQAPLHGSTNNDNHYTAS